MAKALSERDERWQEIRKSKEVVRFCSIFKPGHRVWI